MSFPYGNNESVRRELIPDVVKYAKYVEDIKHRLDNEDIMILSAYRDDLLQMILKYWFPDHARKASSDAS